MRKLAAFTALVAGLLLWGPQYPVVLRAAAAHVQTRTFEQASNATTHGPSTAFAGSVATGNTIIVSACGFRSGTDQNVTGVSDSGGNTYTLVLNGTRIDSEVICSIYYSNNVATGGTLTVTVTWSTGTTGSFAAMEYSGIQTAPSISTNVATGTGTSVSVSLTPTTTPALYIGVTSYNRQPDGAGVPGVTTITPTGTFTERVELDEDNTTQNQSILEKTASSGAQSATWTLGTSSTWTALIASFQESGGGGGGATTKRTLLLGIGARMLPTHVQRLLGLDDAQ